MTLLKRTLFGVIRAVASGVKGGDDYRGPRLIGGPPAISTVWTLRKVDRPLLRVVTKAYHFHVF